MTGKDATHLKPDDLIDERELSKLRWRCRRGLLENDLLLDRFFKQHDAGLTRWQADGLAQLMELSDNDLLDVNLRRKELSDVDVAVLGGVVTAEAQKVLELLRKF